ncbi:MAG: DNA repair protein RecO [Tatlockia sp.]|jgi:DNA repair protein RecO (recombination protein O)
MTTEALQGFVLHKTPSGDTSARVTFFTREKGILLTTYKGGRTPKKQALLHPFSPLWIAVDCRKDWHFVRSIESAAPFAPLKHDALFAGLYVNELLYYVLKPQDPHPVLFNSYEETIAHLANCQDKLLTEALLRRFEWNVLVACGYAVSFTHEIHQNPIHSSHCYQFLPDAGFVRAEKGISGAILLALAEGQLEDRAVLRVAKGIMRKAIEQLLNGRVLKSRALFLAHKSLGN